MRVSLAAIDLKAFEADIARLFLEKRIRAPIHLSGGNEEQLIDIFDRHVNREDWVCTTWRSHYHCLLKGVPPAELRQAVRDGHSISLCFPERRIISSAIVGGIAPIAVGLAAGIKRKGESRKVICFLGDMASRSGIVHESMAYAIGHCLPILWVIEDNGRSCETDTAAAWGIFGDPYSLEEDWVGCVGVIRYRYRLTWPHVGIGQWVTF